MRIWKMGEYLAASSTVTCPNRNCATGPFIQRLDGVDPPIDPLLKFAADSTGCAPCNSELKNKYRIPVLTGNTMLAALLIIKGVRASRYS